MYLKRQLMATPSPSRLAPRIPIRPDSLRERESRQQARVQQTPSWLRKLTVEAVAVEAADKAEEIKLFPKSRRFQKGMAKPEAKAAVEVVEAGLSLLPHRSRWTSPISTSM